MTPFTPPTYARYDGVYLLHFSKPYKQARHYLGYSGKIGTRFNQHKRGQGVPLTKAVMQAGITIVKAREWYGYTRADEKRLRAMHNNPLLCPLCNPKSYKRTVGRHKDIPFI